MILYCFFDAEVPSKLPLLQANDAILLAGDGVYQLQHTTTLKTHTLFALETDLAARGLSTTDLPREVRIIDDATWVALTLQYQQVIPWPSNTF